MSRITEDQIRALVLTFYERVRQDELLGPIFEGRLAGRWGTHLEKMCDFWSSVLLASGRFVGNPVDAHARLPGLRPEHFDRWIELFRRTARDVLPLDIATDVAGRATRMRVALERAACPSSAGALAELRERRHPRHSAPTVPAITPTRMGTTESRNTRPTIGRGRLLARCEAEVFPALRNALRDPE